MESGNVTGIEDFPHGIGDRLQKLIPFIESVLFVIDF
jgi:hypothetical protein